MTDLILKDKIVVYDLVGQRIGWANYGLVTSLSYTPLCFLHNYTIFIHNCFSLLYNVYM